MLTKEPEMLQTDAFCEHAMQQNATAAGGSLQPDPLADFKRVRKGRKGKERNGRKRQDGRGRRREVNSLAVGI